MTTLNYTIICSGLLGGLMIVWLLFELYSKTTKDLCDQKETDKALLKRLEATYPNKSVTNSPWVTKND